jgi:hypothetical protein
MLHFARIFFVAFASATASCSSELAQKGAERKEMGQQLTEAYYSCVRTAFASQRPTMVDRNMAIDQAFMVCQPEQAKLQAFENTLSGNPNASNAAILAYRNTLKEELLRQSLWFLLGALRDYAESGGGPHLPVAGHADGLHGDEQPRRGLPISVCGAFYARPSLALFCLAALPRRPL